MNARLGAAGWRLWCTLLAFAAVLAAALHPAAPLQREVYRYQFVVDITQSMNSRDVEIAGTPTDRLSFAKAAIRTLLLELPCGSEAGLGLFTTRNTEILFEPIEVCAHLPLIDDVLTHIDWRMAWAADSYIAEGLFNALRQLQRRPNPGHLVFFTDGQQTPDQILQPAFSGKPGEHKGIIVGVGGLQPVMIPKLTRDNQLIGYWEIADVTTPVSTTDYQQGRPETAEFAFKSGYYLSRLYEDRLQRLAGVTGLDYRRLPHSSGLSRITMIPEFAETRLVAADLSPTLATAALLLLLGSHFGWTRHRRGRRSQRRTLRGIANGAGPLPAPTSVPPAPRLQRGLKRVFSVTRNGR